MLFSAVPGCKFGITIYVFINTALSPFIETLRKFSPAVSTRHACFLSKLSRFGNANVSQLSFVHTHSYYFEYIIVLKYQVWPHEVFICEYQGGVPKMFSKLLTFGAQWSPYCCIAEQEEPPNNFRLVEGGHIICSFGVKIFFSPCVTSKITHYMCCGTVLHSPPTTQSRCFLLNSSFQLRGSFEFFLSTVTKSLLLGGVI